MEEPNIHKPKLRQSSADLTWYFNHEDGEAGGLRAAHYLVLSAMPAQAVAADVQGFIRGYGSVKPPTTEPSGSDIYPDERSEARQRSRRVYSAIRGIDMRSKAILAAYFADGPIADGYLGVSAAHLRIVALFGPVVRESWRSGRTRLQCARSYVSEKGPEVALAESTQLLNEAIAAFESRLSQ